MSNYEFDFVKLIPLNDADVVRLQVFIKLIDS